MNKNYTIRDLVNQFGVTARTIRHYEDKQLLNPERIGTKRLYTQGDWVRLQLILRGKRVGFSLDEIKEILSLYPNPSGKQKQEVFLLKKLQQRKTQLLEQKKCIDEMIDQLDAIEQGLELTKKN
ncbi:MAG: MerR family transcriptional regulator [Gammaproteobacteria bacterium CG22_combo_CG10-13_8_21_14_all_40_8]|nr:MAG: MerR family transcriptional regulator [Gammaproteobacteria bacterium CG22_combo_CG10-13_8_21_14_all_40_8]